MFDYALEWVSAAILRTRLPKHDGTAAQAKRVSRIQRIVIRKHIRLVRLRDLRVDAQELIGRRIVVAVDCGGHRE
jgi:hypothetical protein